MNNNEKRFLIKVIIACLVGMFVIGMIHILDEPEVSAWENHTVQYGDTLWDIAREHNPNYNGDIRGVMYCIKKANNMKSSTVYVGYVLEVPVMEGD